MKSKEFFGLMFNPFTRIAGLQAFGIGMLLLLLTGFIGSYSNVRFDGVLDMHLGAEISLMKSFSFLAIDIMSVVLVMWFTGLMISKGFRFVDILGTMTLAKAPYLILAVAGYFCTVPDTKEILNNPYIVFQSISFILLIILSLPIIIWSITLMYNGFKVSCDVKGTKLTVAFIIAITVSEIISKILIYFITKNL